MLQLSACRSSSKDLLQSIAGLLIDQHVPRSSRLGVLDPPPIKLPCLSAARPPVRRPCSYHVSVPPHPIFLIFIGDHPCRSRLVVCLLSSCLCALLVWRWPVSFLPSIHPSSSLFPARYFWCDLPPHLLLSVSHQFIFVSIVVLTSEDSGLAKTRGMSRILRSPSEG